MVLHDSHAEILALRGLNHFLLSEIRHMLQSPTDTTDPAETSPFVQTADNECNKVSEAEQWRAPFELHPSVQIFMFCSEPPCGDASMETLMAHKGAAESKPWSLPESETQPENDVLHGRGYFSNLGVVRRKPSRADAEPTLSKSCTDKLAVRQITSLLSFPTRLFIRPSAAAYLHALLLPKNRINRPACERAFGTQGRLKSFEKTDFIGGYAFRPFDVKPVPFDPQSFGFAKPTTSETSMKAGNVSAVWTAGVGGRLECLSETIIGGVRQGHRFDNPKKAGALCRRKLWELGRTITQLLEEDYLPTAQAASSKALLEQPQDGSYAQSKDCRLTRTRREVKDTVTRALGGWARNVGDDSWSIRS